MAFLKRKELIHAAKANDLTTIKFFCSFPLGEAPSETDIKDALNAATQYASTDAVEYLCLSAGASQTDVSETLIAICKWDDKIPNKWKLLSTLCAITAENKPIQTAIDKVLDAAAKAGEWSFVKALCEAENSPSQKAVGNILRIAGTRKLQIMSRNRPANYELPYEVMTHLFERSLIKPSKEDISATLILICEKQDLKKKKPGMLYPISAL
ncbi:MAG: hypothetical protein H0T84_06570 [Tatlockia sp.]|nr:hypothetical protein [Tatlockia sp.]